MNDFFCCDCRHIVVSTTCVARSSLLLVVVARLLYIVVANYAPIHNYDFAFVDTAHSPSAFFFSVSASVPLLLLLLVIMLLAAHAFAAFSDVYAFVVGVDTAFCTHALP